MLTGRMLVAGKFSAKVRWDETANNRLNVKRTINSLESGEINKEDPNAPCI